jgi:monofunctional biosynthetic peptidoglycan transglycosylase
MNKKLIKIIFKTFKIILIVIISLLLTYSVLFTITGTFVLYKGYTFIMAPFKQVQSLLTKNPIETQYMSDHRNKLLRDNQSDTIIHNFIVLDSISPFLKNAVIASEDDGFYTHPGIDIDAILQAAEYNRSHGEFKRGGSTLTQQLSKNLFLNGERSFERKARELAYTLLMEHFLGKDRILELYLNYAQWGKNIFGCEAASQFYFKKSASKLSRNEAARLAAVLAKPSKMNPHSNSAFMGKRLAVIANNLYLHHTIDDEAYYGLTGTIPQKKDSLGVPKPVVSDPNSEKKQVFF